jgi:hypothetical protein
MFKATEIWINRAEGPVKDCVAVTLTEEKLWKQADDLLKRWSDTAPQNGCYDKCDFKVTFEDGELYEGRFDMKHWSVELPDLEDHILHFVRWHAGLCEHPWCGKEQYEQMVEQYHQDGNQGIALDFLDGYQIGDEELHEQ